MDKIAIYKESVGTFLQRLAESKVHEVTGMRCENPMFSLIAEGMVDTVCGSPEGIKGWHGLNQVAKKELAEAILSLKEIKNTLLSKSVLPVIESLTSFLEAQNDVMTDAILEQSAFEDMEAPEVMGAAVHALEGVMFIEATKDLRVKLQEAIEAKDKEKMTKISESMKKVKDTLTEQPTSPMKSFQLTSKKSPEMLKYYKKKAEYKAKMAGEKGKQKATMAGLKATTPRGDMKSGKLYNKYKDPIAIAHMQKTAAAKADWKEKKAALKAKSASECATRP